MNPCETDGKEPAKMSMSLGNSVNSDFDANITHDRVTMHVGDSVDVDGVCAPHDSEIGSMVSVTGRSVIPVITGFGPVPVDPTDPEMSQSENEVPKDYHFQDIDPRDIEGSPYEECLVSGQDNPRRTSLLRRALLRSRFASMLIRYEEIENGIRVWPHGLDYTGIGELFIERPTPLRSYQ